MNSRDATTTHRAAGSQPPSDGTRNESALTRSSRTTADAGELPPLLSGWMDIEYYQIEPGRFEGRLREATYGKTLIVEETQNRTVLKRGIIHGDRCNVGLARSFSADGRSADRRLTSVSTQLLPGGNEFDIQIPAGAINFLSFGREEFAAAAALEGGWFDEDSRQVVHRELPGENAVAALTAVIDLLLPTGPPPAGAISPSDADCAYLQRLLLGNVVAIFGRESEASVSSRGRALAYWTARTASEFIDSVAHDPLTVLDVCRAIKVSRRYLQYCFIEIYGISPVVYLRRIRLNRARKDLMLARGQTSVASIATHWGFWHLGRFSIDYRHLFGESPSETLRRFGK